MRSTISLVLVISFAVTAITGLLMLFAHVRQAGPVHELMSIILTIAAIIHIVLNAKCIGGYIKQKPVLTGTLLAITIAVATLIIIGNPHGRQGHGRHQPRDGHFAIDRD